MLPFLKKSQESRDAGISEAVERKPDDESESYDPLESAAEDLIAALHSKDIKSAAAALRAAYELCSQPQGSDV